VAHAYNSSFLGGKDQEEHGLRFTQAKSWQDMVVCICHPSYKGSSGTKTEVYASPGKKKNPKKLDTEK
jgi:hypothetical protein